MACGVGPALFGPGEPAVVDRIAQSCYVPPWPRDTRALRVIGVLINLLMSHWLFDHEGFQELRYPRFHRGLTFALLCQATQVVGDEL